METMSLPKMGFGRRRKKRRTKKDRGICPGWKQQKIADLQADWDAFEMANLEMKERLTETSSKAAKGFQAPQIDYGLWDWLGEVYLMLVDLPKDKRVATLNELSSFYRQRKGANPYGAFVRACCARWYDNPKRVSWAAVRLEAGIKRKVPAKEFVKFCERYRKES